MTVDVIRQVECFEITTEHIDRSVASAMIDFCRRGR